MINVRPILKHEWPKYREIRLRALQDAPSAFSSTYAAELGRENQIWASRLIDAWASGRDLAVFAESEFEVCDLTWCKITSDQPDVANLFQMWVAPEERGKGVGNQLLQAALDWATCAGAHSMRLGVTVLDSAAMRLYTRNGFVKTGEVEPLREGTDIVAQTMERELKYSAA